MTGITTQEIVIGLCDSVDMREAEETLSLARIAAESLHGADRVRMESAVSIDRGRREFSVWPLGKAGEDLALIFWGYLRREFGSDAVQKRCKGGRV